jgi:hypothetical protein
LKLRGPLTNPALSAGIYPRDAIAGQEKRRNVIVLSEERCGNGSIRNEVWPKAGDDQPATYEERHQPSQE